jgi:hypothetical protein
MRAFDHHHGRYGRVLGGHKTDETGNEIVGYITTLGRGDQSRAGLTGDGVRLETGGRTCPDPYDPLEHGSHFPGHQRADNPVCGGRRKEMFVTTGVDVPVH